MSKPSEVKLGTITTAEWPHNCNLADLLLFRRKAESVFFRTALIYGERTLSYSELSDMVSRAANLLRAQGLKPGDRVMVIVPDCPAFVVSFLGTIAAGGIAVPVSSGLPSDDLCYVASHLGARFVIAHYSFTEHFTRLARVAGISLLLACGDCQGDQAEFEQLLQMHDPVSEAAFTEDDATAYCLLTSGTTGRPKAICHKHTDFLHNFLSYALPVLSITDQDLSLSVPKLTSGYGILCNLLFVLFAGARAVLFREPSTPSLVAELLDQHAVSMLFAQPRFISEILQENNRQTSFRRLRLVVTAGENLSAALYNAFRKEYSIDILNSYGSTEMGALFISTSPGHVVPGSCGRATSGYSVKIVDESNQEVMPNEIGRLRVKGNGMMPGYWGDSTKTAQVMKDGWLDTGDLFRKDEFGNFYCCGRSDDMIKFGCGDWVAPAEIEEAVNAHDAVLECAVVALPDKNGLGRLSAYVVLREGFRPSISLKEELSKIATKKWPNLPYKHLHAIQFTSALPRTATGKLERYKLSPNAVSQFSTKC